MPFGVWSVVIGNPVHCMDTLRRQVDEACLFEVPERGQPHHSADPSFFFHFLSFSFWLSSLVTIQLESLRLADRRCRLGGADFQALLSRSCLD